MGKIMGWTMQTGFYIIKVEFTQYMNLCIKYSVNITK